MDHLDAAEFFRDDQEIGAEVRDQSTGESNDEFPNIRLVTFSFSFSPFFYSQLMIHIRQECDCEMM
jgi:hypothetical protein